MSHITLPTGLPGILGPMAFRPETAKPLNELAEVLLRGPSTLSRADRELIATYVSSRNDCTFCKRSHGAVASHHLGGADELVESVERAPDAAAISDKLKALLRIAGHVQRGGGMVSEQDIRWARKCGASDIELHDVVLIAAAFCMYNRYVDGLATWAPIEEEVYREAGARLAQEGYIASGDALHGVAHTAQGDIGYATVEG